MSQANTDLAVRVRKLVSVHGVQRTAKLLGISRASTVTICAELPVKAGTIALVRINLPAEPERERAA